MSDIYETGMTVRELIEHLQDMPKDAIVIYRHFNCDLAGGEHDYEVVRKVRFNVRKIYGVTADTVEMRVR